MKIKKKILITIGFPLLIFVALFCFLFFNLAKIPTEAPPQEASSQIALLCTPYPQIQEEIDCPEAVRLALEEYPGRIYKVSKIKQMPNEQIKEGQAIYQSSYLISIKLDKPINIGVIKTIDIELIINSKNGNVHIFSFR